MLLTGFAKEDSIAFGDAREVVLRAFSTCAGHRL